MKEIHVLKEANEAERLSAMEIVDKNKQHIIKNELFE